MNRDQIIKQLRDMAKHPTVTLPRDCEALRAAADLLAQPEQEPVAFICQGNAYMADDVDEYCTATHIPLYTTPPQRKPLTDEEIGRIAGDSLDAWSCARAIEAAHGIKGEPC